MMGVKGRKARMKSEGLKMKRSNRPYAQCESAKNLISPPEKKVPIKLPRVIGRSRCNGFLG